MREDPESEWTIQVYDVEAAFLNAKMGTQMFIELPQEMVLLGFITKEERQEYVAELTASMYGNVDAALQWFKAHKNILLGLGLVQSKADPCVFIQRDKRGLKLAICSHVDNTAVVGQKPDVEAMMTEYEKHLKIERLGELKKNLCIWWEWHQDKGGSYLTATLPQMITKSMTHSKRHKEEIQDPHQHQATQALL